MGVKEEAKRFLFLVSMEAQRDKIVENLRNILAPINPSDVPDMVKHGQYPPLGNLEFAKVIDKLEFLEEIPLESLVEYIMEANTAVFSMIEAMGAEGATYLVNLRGYLIKKIKEAAGAPAASADFTPKAETVLLKCDQCGKSIPWPKDKPMGACPFCSKK